MNKLLDEVHATESALTGFIVGIQLAAFLGLALFLLEVFS